jgi:tRNA threonylcarbamoyladenosine biosynthesis protein TsaB
MASLRQILAESGSLLVLDATGCAQAVYWPDPASAPLVAQPEGEMGRALFQAVRRVCPRLDEPAAFAFAEAPGSILGIRTAAAALRVWTALRPRPVYAYHALELAATRTGATRAWIADARRGRWHLLIPGQPVRCVGSGELAAARGELPLATPAHYRHWEALPAGSAAESYDVGPLLAAAPEADLFQRSDSPDAARFQEPTYLPWTPRIHQMP